VTCTTIDLPEDAHRAVVALARDRSQSMGEVVAALVRQALGTGSAVAVRTDGATGLPVVSLGRPITAEDVRSLDRALAGLHADVAELLEP
jgi:hypothetical protein